MNWKIDMENRIRTLFDGKSRNILSVYFTAGFPGLHDTACVIELLAKYGADMIEIGIPFSDPTADGRVIQHSNQVALKNGMSLGLLFEQLETIRSRVEVPLILMGYVNPVLRFGMERFCRKCRKTGIDGIILPDLPMQEYTRNYEPMFKNDDLCNILLITPQTPEKRVHEIDAVSNGFLYMVSSSSTTGTGKNAAAMNTGYFDRIQKMNLRNPCMIGFGISDRETFTTACSYAAGAIIGSAFISALQNPDPLDRNVAGFMESILGSSSCS
jgi:tryptophan synthase alpha chain